MELNVQIELASNIKSLRLVHKYTQTQVADRLHMCRSTYALLELGKRNPHIGFIIDLANLYGVTPDVVLNANKAHIFDLIDSTDKYKLQLMKLFNIYDQLTPYMRGCLMERAEVLLTTAPTKL